MTNNRFKILELDYQSNDSEDEYMLIINLDEDDIDQNELKRYVGIFATNDCNIITFNSDKYLDDILKSYKYRRKNIISQFCFDFPRSEYFVDDENMIDCQDLIKKIDQYENISYNSDYSKLNMKDIFLMLCNQSSYAYVYFLMTKLFSNDDGIVVLNCPTNRSVKINCMDCASISLNSDYIVFDLKKYKNLFKVRTELLIQTNIYRDDKIFMVKNKRAVPKFGMLYWKILSFPGQLD